MGKGCHLGLPRAVRKALPCCQVGGLEAGQVSGPHSPAGWRTSQLPGPSPPPASLPFAVLSLVNAPYKRGFYYGDDSIRYPYRPDTITHGLMAGVTVTATVILVSAGEAYLVHTDRLYSRSDFNNYVAAVYKVLGTFLFGAAVSQSLTDLAKYTIGRLRPNFLAVCDPEWSRVNCSVYVQLESVCRGKAADVTEARLSFYSGHASFGMYCMVFLAVSPFFRGSPVKSLPSLDLGFPSCRMALRAGASLLEVGAAAAPHGPVLPGGLCPLCGLHPRV
nr:phospholipid phosphatase 2 isoform X1 [Saimiri boliviensis boliviensis]